MQWIIWKPFPRKVQMLLIAPPPARPRSWPESHQGTPDIRQTSVSDVAFFWHHMQGRRASSLGAVLLQSGGLRRLVATKSGGEKTRPSILPSPREQDGAAELGEWARGYALRPTSNSAAPGRSAISAGRRRISIPSAKSRCCRERAGGDDRFFYPSCKLSSASPASSGIDGCRPPKRRSRPWNDASASARSSSPKSGHIVSVKCSSA